MAVQLVDAARFLAWTAFWLLVVKGIGLLGEWYRMARLSKDDILKAEDLVSEEVEVPEWGGSVMVRGLTGRERDEFEASIMERRGKRLYPNVANVRAKLVARCCIDEAGERLFTDQDAEALGGKSGAAMDRVYEVAAKLSGMTEEDIDEMVENFGGTPSDGSSSASPKTRARR